MAKKVLGVEDRFPEKIFVKSDGANLDANVDAFSVVDDLESPQYIAVYERREIKIARKLVELKDRC